MSVKLSALSRTYGEFYAPAFSIRIGDDDLMRNRLIAVAQVEVDLELGAAGRFSFAVVNAYDIEKHAFRSGDGRDVIQALKFGTRLQVWMGYGDFKSMRKVMSGVVTEISTSFPESGAPELTISGYDHGFLLTGGKNTFTWTDAKDSAAARRIAGVHNLPATIEETAEEHAQIEQNQESDFEFLKKLADRNHYELFVDEHGKLHFHKPNDKADPVVTLAWGEGLLSFKPEANLAGQVSRVEVHGWDHKRKKQIVGEARAGEESGLEGQEKSAGQYVNAALIQDPDKLPVLRLRQPVFTMSEARERAKAALNEHAKKFLTGEAESIGLPEIRPDYRVRLENLGDLFSKAYYVQKATHRIDANGYRTRFTIKETKA